VSLDLYRLFYQHALENVEAWLAGRPIREVPDYRAVPAGYPPPWVEAPRT
jgi:hypothetical protein